MSGSTLKGIVAVVLLVLFAALMVFLLANVGVSQASWERYVYLLSGVEAVVFAAVGWLFGKEVHREQAQNAEANAERAGAGHLSAAGEAAAERANGLALARAVIAHTEPAAEAGSHATVERASSSAADPLVRMANDAYPELSGRAVTP